MNSLFHCTTPGRADRQLKTSLHQAGVLSGVWRAQSVRDAGNEWRAGRNALSLRRQDRHRFHFDEIRRIGEPRYLEQGRGGQRRLVGEKGGAHLTVGVGILLYGDRS
jgi:hypothetical protein